MSQSASLLADLRREIDRVDTAIAQLLVERRNVVAEIGRIKGGGLAFRPGREAMVLRRLIAETSGQVAPETLVRVWREVFAAATRLQGGFNIAVCAPAGHRELWDLARGHFGSGTDVTRVDRPAQALRALGEDTAQVAVLPAPSDDELWWTGLIEGQPRSNVVARLPFLYHERQSDPLTAFAVAKVAPDPSDDDQTLLVVEAPAGISRGRLKDLLAAAGLQAEWLAVVRPRAESPDAAHLIAVDGFLEADDRRLVPLGQDNPRDLRRVVRLGAYARQLRAGERAGSLPDPVGTA
ncbi:MAG: chorismate mutase [Pseudomonadota bacterium]